MRRAEVPQRVCYLAQLIPPVDDRSHLARLEEIAHEREVVLFDLREEVDDLLALPGRKDARADDVLQRAEPLARHRRPDHDDRRLRLEHPLEPAEGAASDDV